MAIRDGLYCVDDIARYIINYSNKRGYSISNLKLQKLLYFVQANFLTSYDGIPCFDEKIEAWDFGPVVPQVYREYREYGSGSISPITHVLRRSATGLGYVRMRFSDDFIDDDDKELIDEMIEYGAPYTASQLVDITHNQAPWKRAYMRSFNNEITKESIYEYFKD